MSVSIEKPSGEQTVVHYQIDPAKSSFTIKVSASGLLSMMGHNPTMALRDFSGEVSFVPETLEKARLRLVVLPDSFEVTDDMSQSDKREVENATKRDVLETSRFSEIIFESEKVSIIPMGRQSYIANISGNLNLHGVVRPRTIVCQVAVNGEALRAYGGFSLRQTEYEIKLISVAGGTLKVKDEIKSSFDIVAHMRK